MRTADFPVPDTAAARGARELADEYQSHAIAAHATRSWLWAEAFAALEGAEGTDAVDHELLYVAALLHDIGTVTEYDNHSTSYEHAGGHVAVALTAGAGWPDWRRRRVLEVIVRHNWPSVDPRLDWHGTPWSSYEPDARPRRVVVAGLEDQDAVTSRFVSSLPRRRRHHDDR